MKSKKKHKQGDVVEHEGASIGDGVHAGLSFVQSHRKLALVIPEPSAPAAVTWSMVEGASPLTPDAYDAQNPKTPPSGKSVAPALGDETNSQRPSAKSRFSITGRNASVLGKHWLKTESTPMVMSLRDLCLEISSSVLLLREKDYDFLKDEKNSISELLRSVERNMDAWLYNPELIPRLSRATRQRGSLLSISATPPDMPVTVDPESGLFDFVDDAGMVHALDRLSKTLHLIQVFFNDLVAGTGRVGMCGCALPQLTMYTLSDNSRATSLTAAADLAHSLKHDYGHLRVAIKKYLIKRVATVPLHVLPPRLHPANRHVEPMNQTTLDMVRIADLCYMNLAYVTEVIKLAGEEAEDIDEESRAALELEPPEGYYIELGKQRDVTLKEREHHAKVVPFINPDITFCDPNTTGKLDARMYVLRYKNVLCFAFRGTETKNDILDDLNAVPVTPDELPSELIKEGDQGIKVHLGFYNHWKALETRVNVEIRVFLYLLSFTQGRTDPEEQPEIIFTGHSLGGAVAVIAAFYIKVWFTTRVRVSCYTFGAPRSGNRAFAKTFDRYIDKCQRIVYNMDPIPHVPPRRLGYVHVSGGIWIHGGKPHLAGYKKERARHMMREYFNVIKTFGKSQPWSDHQMVHYMNELEGILEQNRAPSKWRKALGYLSNFDGGIGKHVMHQLEQTKEAVDKQGHRLMEGAQTMNKAAFKKAVQANKKAIQANKKALATAKKANKKAKLQMRKDYARTKKQMAKDVGRAKKVMNSTKETGSNFVSSTVNLTPLKKRQTMAHAGDAGIPPAEI